MAKLTAFLVGTFLLLVLAYSELASGFSPLINWLGPVFGVPLQFLLGLIFIMVGNPVSYPSILIAWVIVGIVVGLLVRRTGGAILSAFLAYVAGWLFLILSGVMVFFRLFPSGFASLSSLSTGVSVPPAPPGTDIATILHEPLLNGLPSLFVTATSDGGAFNSVSATWVSLALSWMGNFFILLFAACLTAYVSRGASIGLRRFLVTSKFRNGSHGSASKVKASIVTFLLLVVVISSLSFSASAAQTSDNPNPTCVTSDNQNQNPQVALAYGIAQPNLWNTASSQGSVTLCYGPLSGLSASVAISSIQLQQSHAPIGYPEAAYGNNLNGDDFGLQSGGFQSFPIQVSTLGGESFWINVSYSVSANHPYPMDVGYDFWIKVQQAGKPTSSDFELLVLPFDSFFRCLAPNSYSDQVYINQNQKSVTWNVCKQQGSGGAQLYAFSLDSADQLLSGSVDLQPNDFISYLATNLASVSISDYWLMGVEFGTEFAPNLLSQASMTWAMSAFSLTSGSKTVYIIPRPFVGINNSVVVSNPSALSSDPCPQGLNQPKACFSLQQNFYLQDPAQASPLYWVQNVVVFGIDTSGNHWVLPAFNIWDGPRTTLKACNGVPTSQTNNGQTAWTCSYTARVYQEVESPETIDLASVVSGGVITLTTSSNGASLSSVGCPGSFNCLLFPSLPLDSYITTSQASGQSYAPELDIVGPPAGGHVSFSDGTDIIVSSSVALEGAAWSNSVFEYPTSAPWTLEGSSGLQWSCAGVNSASFAYNSAGADEGVGYEPAPKGQLAVSCVTPSMGNGYGNTSVDVWGTGFAGATSVDFGPNNPSADFEVISDSEIQAHSPAGSGVVDVTVTAPLGTSAITSYDKFTYVVASGFSPITGPTSGGTLVTITGEGFGSPAQVWFGTSESTNVIVVSPTTITAVSPPGTGTIPISVEVGALGNIPIEGSDEFTYGTNVSTPYYLESVLGEVNPDGSVTSFYSFLTNSATQNHLFSPNSDEAFVLVFSQSGGLSLLPSSLSGTFSSYTSFIPQTMVFLAYTSDCTGSQTQATTAAASIATKLQAPDLSLIVSFPLYNVETSTGPSSQACGFVYGSGTPLSTVGPEVGSEVLPSVSKTGLINILKDGLITGNLIPNQTPTSVNATVLVAGFGSASALSNSLQFILPYNEASIPSPTGLIGFAGAVTLRSGVVHSSSNVHSESFGQLLNYQEAVSFTNSSTLSVTGIGAPPPGSSPSSWTDLAPADQLVLYTNNPTAASSLGSQSSVNLLYSGQSIPSSNLRITFTGLFPANLKVSKSFTLGGNDNVLVSVNVRNLDTSPVTLVSEDDSAFLNSYSSGANLVSGAATNSSSMILNPNASISYRYTVHLIGIGSYYSTPAKVSYLLNGTSFTAESNAAVWQQTLPSAPQAIMGLLGSVAVLINHGVGTTQSAPIIGSLIIYAPLLLLIGLAARSEYRSFRGWGRADPETARKLEGLKRMLDSGLITKKDFEEQRRRIMTSR